MVEFKIGFKGEMERPNWNLNNDPVRVEIEAYCGLQRPSFQSPLSPLKQNWEQHSSLDWHKLYQSGWQSSAEKKNNKTKKHLFSVEHKNHLKN